MLSFVFYQEDKGRGSVPCEVKGKKLVFIVNDWSIRRNVVIVRYFTSERMVLLGSVYFLLCTILHLYQWFM